MSILFCVNSVMMIVQLSYHQHDRNGEQECESILASVISFTNRSLMTLGYTSRVTSSSVPMHWRSKDAGTSQRMLFSPLQASKSSLSLNRKLPSRIYHSINLTTFGTTQSLRIVKKRQGMRRGGGRICPLCCKIDLSSKCRSRSIRAWKEFRKRSKLESV